MRITVNDIAIFFDVDGPKLVADGPTMREQPTLIVLQGGPGFDHSYFGPNHSPLVDIAQIIYLDHRGNGRSERSSPEHWTLDQWAADLVGFCDALDINRPVILGMSFGGFVAMNFAARYPDRLAGLVLVSTTARVRPEPSLDVFERLGGAEARAAAEAMFADPGEQTAEEYFRLCFPLYAVAPPDSDRFARLIAPPELFQHLFENITPCMDLFPALAEVRCPTLVIGGQDDPITPVADMTDIATTLGENLAGFECLPGARHFLVQDAPDAYFAALRRFLTETLTLPPVKTG